MRFIARINSNGEEQPLIVHLLGTADKARTFAQSFHAGELAYAAGLHHDLGKFKLKPQLRIRNYPIKATHSTAGALEIGKDSTWRAMFGPTRLHKHLATLVQFAIAFHHGGLRNYGNKDEPGSLCHRLASAAEDPEEQEHLWEAAWQEIERPSLPIPMDGPLVRNLLRQQSKEAYSWKLAFLGRMIYSCLVDADTIDTRDFCDPASAQAIAAPGTTIRELHDRLEQYLAVRFANAEPTIVNRYRKAILERCKSRAQLPPQLFSLSVPTGGGKTFSSLAFALAHAKENDLRRVIYVIPLTSITEQNAAEFRNALGPEVVLEHHSHFHIGDLDETLGETESLRYKLSTENWDAPLVVTTSVQFFESLFASRRSKCRKLHNIAKSVIVIDEAQSLPRGYLEPCLRALEELVEGYGCSVVLCTATHPSWEKLGRRVKEIMDEPTPSELERVFKRTAVELRGKPYEPVRDSTLAEWLLDEHQALCIVNTRRHAKKLLKHFNPKVDGLFHLSGRMTPLHRAEVLDEIRKRLKDGKRCIVISTQLIEAGVDVDFPVVYRAIAGIDSIAQAAGRCNREGKLETGRVIVFHPEPHGLPSIGWLKETAVEATNCIDLYGAENMLSLACISEYFERIHGTRDNEAGPKLRDQYEIVKMMTRTPPHFPYQDIAERFKFIESDMESIVVPWRRPADRSDPNHPQDEHARELIDSLTTALYPAAVLRKLQPYVVQVYPKEREVLQHRQLIQTIQGVHVLNDFTFYDRMTGLTIPDED
ncbi:CRISPR-associated helicase Cas3/CRISPR-associated endonuclease Cas3-HD [Thermobacillus composti KWC4]|uniref:CRISPR-associated helicase Cas3/CRISPR-associated endonuclease Cas3-HD n=1 Tax=Thermobacillus composti (strain DSM 18247 / JCM 13945 / KWC4) TaxID=717605 RepID=L0EJC1_THECK|nr:CRISPR-associated helicase/endonuclease Cas3 [Thermobacillus composti]AGA59290.1 CRISPR-associated helicase Cas3/CRISPR-associated endonuclease Cas3-HD [Thermobacillus composti KWC4]